MKKMRLDNVFGFHGYRIVKENKDPGCSLKERTITGVWASWQSVVLVLCDDGYVRVHFLGKQEENWISKEDVTALDNWQ
jgi:hypothetical protein